MIPFEGRFRVCDPGDIHCPVCGHGLPRRHVFPGHSLDHCDRKLLDRGAGTRCNTHLYITRGVGERHALVIALRSASERDRLLQHLEPEALAPSA